MRTLILAGMAVAGLVLGSPVYASSELAAKNKCTMCHDVDKKKTGPAFKDVAAAHKGKAGDEAVIVAKLLKGDGHKKITADEADVKALVKWVLAM